MNFYQLKLNKMKILITGSNGYLGEKLLSELKKDYTIIAPKKSELDLTDSDQVDKFMKNKFFDWVIQCAIIGGRRLDIDDSRTTYHNLKIFFNLMNNRESFKKMINFSSGAEFDRRKEINNETNNLLNSFPVDYYGMSKNIISKLIKDYPYYNLRLYGIFGPGEKDDRFIKMCIKNSKIEKNIVINNDKFFDFFYVEDLLKIIKSLISNKMQQINFDFDVVYKEKLRLSQIANYINELSNNKAQVLIENSESNSYTGTYNKSFDNLNLVGLKDGIRRIFEAH
jgi:dTDP-4-dehydrorhamnose reductase